MLAFNLQPVQTPDMPPINPSSIDLALKHAEGWPITVGFFSLVIIIAAAFYWLLFRFYPSWQAAQAQRAANMTAEAEKTRQHMSEVLNARGAEASKDVKAIADAIGIKVDHMAKDCADVEAMTRELTGKFSEVHTKVSGIHDLVRAMASKTGVVAALLILGGTMGYMGAWSCMPVRRGVAAAAGVATATPSPTPCSAAGQEQQKQCTRNTDCPAPQYCSGGYCVRNAASNVPKPESGTGAGQGQGPGPKKQPDSQATSQPHGGDLYRDYGEGGVESYTVEWRRDSLVSSPRWL